MPRKPQTEKPDLLAVLAAAGEEDLAQVNKRINELEKELAGSKTSSPIVTERAARIAALTELRRLADKLAAGVVEHDAIGELLSGRDGPRLVFQPWYLSVNDPEQKALHSDLGEVLKNLAVLMRPLERPEVKEIGCRLLVLAERLREALSSEEEPEARTSPGVAQASLASFEAKKLLDRKLHGAPECSN